MSKKKTNRVVNQRQEKKTDNKSRKETLRVKRD